MAASGASTPASGGRQRQRAVRPEHRSRVDQAAGGGCAADRTGPARAAGTTVATAAVARPGPSRRAGTPRAAPARATGCPACRSAAGAPPATEVVDARSPRRGRAGLPRRDHAAAAPCSAARSPAGQALGQLGEPSSRTATTTSTWSATSRRSAKISACRDGRSAQWASSTSENHGGAAEPVEELQQPCPDRDRVVDRIGPVLGAMPRIRSIRSTAE